MAKLTPEQARAKWEALSRRWEQAVPTGFRGAMQKMHTRSREELDKAVYSWSGATKRTSHLRGSENLYFTSATAAELRNQASSEWHGKRTNYARIIAEGRKAGDKGTKYYAWMKSPFVPRPDSLQGWFDAVKAGNAVLTHRTRAVAGKPWRKRAIERAQSEGLFTAEIAQGVRKAVNDANSEAGAR